MNWTTVALAGVLLAGVVIAAGLALDDPDVLDAIEREAATLRRAYDWSAAEWSAAFAWLVWATFELAAWLTERYTAVQHAYRPREARHGLVTAYHRAAASVRPAVAMPGRHRVAVA